MKQASDEVCVDQCTRHFSKGSRVVVFTCAVILTNNNYGIFQMLLRLADLVGRNCLKPFPGPAPRAGTIWGNKKERRGAHSVRTRTVWRSQSALRAEGLTDGSAIEGMASQRS